MAVECGAAIVRRGMAGCGARTGRRGQGLYNTAVAAVSQPERHRKTVTELLLRANFDLFEICQNVDVAIGWESVYVFKKKL
jgi:hypothetical protein